jgi:hypothetical protein
MWNPQPNSHKRSRIAKTVQSISRLPAGATPHLLSVGCFGATRELTRWHELRTHGQEWPATLLAQFGKTSTSVSNRTQSATLLQRVCKAAALLHPAMMRVLRQIPLSEQREVSASTLTKELLLAELRHRWPHGLADLQAQ